MCEHNTTAATDEWIDTMVFQQHYDCSLFFKEIPVQETTYQNYEDKYIY